MPGNEKSDRGAYPKEPPKPPIWNAEDALGSKRKKAIPSAPEPP